MERRMFRDTKSHITVSHSKNVCWPCVSLPMHLFQFYSRARMGRRHMWQSLTTSNIRPGTLLVQYILHFLSGTSIIHVTILGRQRSCYLMRDRFFYYCWKIRHLVSVKSKIRSRSLPTNNNYIFIVVRPHLQTRYLPKAAILYFIQVLRRFGY